MTIFSLEFKLQSVEKALSKRPEQTIKNIADNVGVGYSTLQKWIRLAKNNKLEKPNTIMTKEKSPQDWDISQRFEAVAHCYSLHDEQVSTYCREKGIYPHHIKEWKTGFLSNNQDIDSPSKLEQKKLKQENKQLHSELDRKNRALSETAALLVLSKKCQAIWGEREVG